MAQQLIEPVGTRPTLLVVEDDPHIRSLLRDLFTVDTFDVVIAESGAAALETMEQQPIDLVVLDVMLPDATGYDVCRRIRSSIPLRVPILMLTALTQQDNVTLGLEAGADDYVKKPFAPEELMLRVTRLLERYDETRAAEQEITALQKALDLVQSQLQRARNETQVETTLRQEFLHNVTTHLQALYGITEAAARKVSPGPNREIVQQIKSRVRGAALVYQISSALQSEPVEIGYVIRMIASALKSMYRPWQRVQLNVEGGEIEVPLVIASPFAMIINELITNCFKHAFPDTRFGTVSVSYGVVDGIVQLEVRDNGVGFAADSSTGSGRATVTQLVQDLQGTIDWETGESGTRVVMRVPLPPSQPVPPVPQSDEAGMVAAP